MTTLPCLRCGQPLPSVLGPAADISQPAGGTVFTSYGQYGSTVFDEADGSFLMRMAAVAVVTLVLLSAAVGAADGAWPWVVASAGLGCAAVTVAAVRRSRRGAVPSCASFLAWQARR